MKALFSALLFSLSLNALAETPLTLSLSVDSWQNNIHGKLDGGERNDFRLDLRDQLEMSDKIAAPVVALQLEHELPLPNLRLARSLLEYDSQTQATGYRFGGSTFNGPLSTTVNLDHWDILLYGRAVQGRLDVNVGGGLRLFDGYAELSQAGLRERAKISSKMPVFFLQLNGELGRGFSLGGEMTALGFNNNGTGDIQARLAWQSPWGLGLRGGYRIAKLILRKEVGGPDGESNSVLRGPYMGLFYAF